MKCKTETSGECGSFFLPAVQQLPPGRCAGELQMFLVNVRL